MGFTIWEGRDGKRRRVTFPGRPLVVHGDKRGRAIGYPTANMVLDPATEVLPVNGSREALFAFAQTVLDPTRPARVVCPNPFYQIYEGAALLAGATPVYGTPEDWSGVQLVYACSPANPTGKVLSLGAWRSLFDLSDRHGFIIAADECYSEIYFDEPPLGALEASCRLNRPGFERLVVFSSLSKRSNCPGMRSGFVAGDRDVLHKYLQYRTYHGCALPVPTQLASIAAWNDEQHVRENRELYRQKFARVFTILKNHLDLTMPDAGFYFWPRTPYNDTDFARDLFAEQHVTVLPGQYLARPTSAGNPGENRIRLALVATLDECCDAAERIKRFCENR